MKTLEPPEGYEIIEKGTTDSGDLVWNLDLEKWEPVDSINEYVEYYWSVCRKKV